MFVTLEGIDRSGKTTQASLLAESLGPDALLLREPGGTPAGERVRAVLKDPEVELTPLAELLLFCAARAQLVETEVRPALVAGRDVVCDRFTDSSVAYQGHARGLGAELVEELCRIATGGLEPDLTILIRIDPVRAAERAGASDRFEAEGAELQRAVAAGYDAVATAHPDRVVAIDGDDSVDAVHERVMAAIAERRGR